MDSRSGEEEEACEGWDERCEWLVVVLLRGSLSRAASVEGGRVWRVSRVAFSVAGVGLAVVVALRLGIEVELPTLALVECPLVSGSGRTTAGDGTMRFASLVFANASRFEAASVSDIDTEYVGWSLLPRGAPPPPGA